MIDDKIDKIKEKLTKGVAVVNIKTSLFLETAKIKTHILTLQNEIKEVKYSIGNKAFDMWYNSSFDLDKLKEQFLIIEENIETIKKLREEIENLQNQQKQVFGMEDDKTEENVEETKEVKEEMEAGEEICPNCKNTYTKPASYCKDCGQKL